MKKFILILLTIVALSAGVGYYFLKYQKKTIQKLENQISFLKETYTPLKFKILDRDSNKLKVAVKFMDMDSNEIQKSDFTLEGHELMFDFFTIQIKDRYLSFPTKIFTDMMPPQEGVDLTQYYNVDGFPQIFNDKEITPEAKVLLTELFSKIRENKTQDLKQNFGNCVHDIQKFKSFREDYIYSILAHTKGGLEIIEN